MEFENLPTRYGDHIYTYSVEELNIPLGYKVSYSKYVELRAERLAQQTAAYENQQRMIEKTEDFINKFRYKPTKSNQVQSRIKALEKIVGADEKEAPADDRLVEALTAWRTELSSEKGCPAYVIMHQKTLLKIAQTKPSSKEELLAIDGYYKKLCDMQSVN